MQVDRIYIIGSKNYLYFSLTFVKIHINIIEVIKGGNIFTELFKLERKLIISFKTNSKTPPK